MAEATKNYLDPKVLNKISKLELRARLVVEGFVSGMHRSPYRGYSVEFAQHREYVPGDDIRFLDWKILGKSDRFYVKEFEEERAGYMEETLCDESEDEGEDESDGEAPSAPAPAPTPAPAPAQRAGKRKAAAPPRAPPTHPPDSSDDDGPSLHAPAPARAGLAKPAAKSARRKPSAAKPAAKPAAASSKRQRRK